MTTNNHLTTTSAPTALGGAYVLHETTTRDSGGLGLRLAGLTGAASLVAAFVGLSIAETNTLGLDPDTPAGVLVDTYSGLTAELRAGAILCAVAAVLALVFCGPLWMRYKESGEWQAMVAVAGALTMGLAWLAAAAEQVAFLTVAHYGNGEAARMVLITGWDTGRYLTLIPFLVLAIAGTLAALPFWFRAVSAVVAALEASALVPGSDDWFPAMLGAAYGITVSLLVTLSSGGDSDATR